MRRPNCLVGKRETTRHVHHRRRYGPTPSLWAGRAVCVVALAGVVAVGLAQRQPVQPETPSDPGICPVLQVLAAATLYDRVPPPAASPELEAFVRSLNSELSTVRTQIKESCRG